MELLPFLPFPRLFVFVILTDLIKPMAHLALRCGGFSVGGVDLGRGLGGRRCSSFGTGPGRVAGAGAGVEVGAIVAFG